jgi:hypothetical protein
MSKYKSAYIFSMKCVSLEISAKPGSESRESSRMQENNFLSNGIMSIGTTRKEFKVESQFLYNSNMYI